MLAGSRPNPLKRKGFFIPLLLGIDIGGTKVALALGDEQGCRSCGRNMQGNLVKIVSEAGNFSC